MPLSDERLPPVLGLLHPNLAYVRGDILRAHETHGVTVWAHQCNTLGRWQAGLHLAIGEAFPEVVEAYLNKHRESGLRLGDAELYPTHVPGLRIAYLAGQDRIGNARHTGERYTNYLALAQAMRLLRYQLKPEDVLTFPFLIGCGLAGGNPEVVALLISQTFSGRKVLIFVP